MNLPGLVSAAWTEVGNALRSTRRRGLAHIALTLSGAYPEWPPPPLRLPFPLGMLLPFAQQVSLADMRQAVRLLGADSRVRSVVLLFGSLHASFPALHSLRQLVLDLRSTGKRVLAWVPSAGVSEYYLASACDEILMPESGELAVLGLRAEALFLKDTLSLVGVEADLESIAEYKTAPDMFLRSTMSEPHREMLDALVGSCFEHILGSIAEARDMAPSKVQKLIDEMPMAAFRAAEAGLIDAVMYEDQIPAYLAKRSGNPSGKGGKAGDDGGRREGLTTWEQAARWLRRPPRPRARQTIGVVSVEGVMTMGPSRRPPAPLPIPFVHAQAGAAAVAQALRQAETDRRIAAVILHVDTPGGSALAADLICREVRRLRERKPVVVLMGAQAASGGYYVSACANRVVARPTTMTGSIGVWGGKFVLRELYGKLGVGSASVQRGSNAGLYSPVEPFDDRQRARVRQELGDVYARFARIVAEGRGLSREEVEVRGRGRVWTGAQAREAGLVDELGGYEVALESAKQLAGLDLQQEYRVVRVHPGRQYLLPEPSPSRDALWSYALDGLRELARERIWAMSPWVVQIKG